MSEPSEVPSVVFELAAQLAQPRAMRRGSVTERFVKCNKPTCPCASDPDARHGPYFSVSRVVKGKTRSQWLTGEQAKTVRRQVDAGHRFRRHVDAYWDACERWAEAEIKAPDAAPEEAAKKGGSRKPSTRRSSPK